MKSRNTSYNSSGCNVQPTGYPQQTTQTAPAAARETAQGQRGKAEGVCPRQRTAGAATAPPRNRKGLSSLCLIASMDVTDNPVVRALVKEVIRHGQKVIAFLKGTMLSICDAATRAVLFLYDLARVPVEWLAHWWGSAFDWVVRHAGDGCASTTRRPNLAHDDRPRQDGNMQALEEGLNIAAEAEGSSQTAPAPPAFEQHQHSRLFETKTDGVVSRVTAGQETQKKVTVPSTVVANNKATVPTATRTATNKVTVSSTTANEFPTRSSVAHVSKYSVGSAVEGTAPCSGSDRAEIMPFRLVEGEEEEAASFVPFSLLTTSRAGRPVRWSLDYLCENVEDGCGTIMGTGNFAKVAVTTLKTSGVKMAVKAITTYTDDLGSMDEIIDMELKTLQAAGAHPNVVDCLGYVKTTETMYVMMPMIQTDLANLLAKVGPLSEVTTQQFMRQVTSAAEFLHSRNILHRDLKPANLLLTEENKLLLADFGLATIIPPGETVVSGLPCGTKAYMSPEQVESEGVLDYSTKVDTWGLGVIAYEMLHDRMPFRPVFDAKDGNNAAEDEAKVPALGEVLELKYIDSADIQERANIISATYTLDDQLVSADGKDFIAKLLEKDVDMRLSAGNAAEHQWLGGMEAATEVRIKVADAIAAREVKIKAEQAARLPKGRKRGARCRVKAVPIETGQGKGIVSGRAGDGGETNCQT